MQEMRQQQINIELGEAEAEGIYSNLAMIVFSPTEMVIDFARIMPRMPKTKVKSRIIMSPMHAKLLMKNLADNIEKFEKQYGEIKVYGANVPSKSIGFESGTPETGDGK